MRRTPAPRPSRTAGPAAGRTASPAAGPAAVLRLQSLAGNAAVAALLNRQPSHRPNDGGELPLAQRLAIDCPPAPPPPAAVTPAADPRFAAATRQIAATARTARQHPLAVAEVVAAQGAAPAPLDDKQAQAEAAQTATMAAARPGGFDKAAFIAAVRAAVARHAPPNLEEADRFASSGRSDRIRSDVQGLAGRSTSEAARDIAGRTAQPPDPGVAVEKPVTPLAPVPPAPALAAPHPGLVTPAPAPAEQTDLRAGPCQTSAMMTDAGVTDEQLAESNEPDFTDALADKQAGERHSATAPAQVREVEARELAATFGSARAVSSAGVSAMAGAHETSRSGMDTARTGTVAADHHARAALNAELRPVFTATKQDVERVLSELDGKVGRRFDDGERQARAAFTSDHQARLARYKSDRYAGPAGWARWLADLPGLPAEANQLYHQSKQLYEERMQAVVAELADLVGSELGRAKARIAEGRRRVEQIVASKPAALQRVAHQAAADFNREFDTLQRSVDDKQRSLVDDLAERYVAARGAVDAEIERLQQENEGLWGKAKEAVAGTIRTITQLKDLLTGVLARAAGAVELIIKAPVRFLGNLISAVKGGVVAFGTNIWTHLRTGLKAWLLGSLGDAGLEVPERFDLPGILRLVLSVLGLTWTKIRSRIVQVIPEPVVQRLEQTVEVVQTLVTAGLPGLWRWVLEKVGDIKEMVLGQIKSFVVEKVVKAGIVWLVSMLNPASAFIKACQAIYGIVMFFIQRASQIKSFVDSVLDSIGAIARGGGGAVAGIVENALARALPVVIGFLASLLNLGGVPDQIRSAIDTVRAPVTNAVDWVVGMVVKAGKSLMSRLRGGRGEPERGTTDDPNAVKARARKLLEQRTNRPFRSSDELQQVTDSVLNELRGDGLKSLSATESRTQPGRYDILAAASQEEEVGKATVLQVDAAAVREAIAQASERQRRAAVVAQDEASRLQALGTKSGDDQARRITVAVGLSVFKQGTGGLAGALAESRANEKLLGAAGSSPATAAEAPAPERDRLASPVEQYLAADAAKWEQGGRVAEHLLSQGAPDQPMPAYPVRGRGARQKQLEYLDATGVHVPVRSMFDRDMTGGTETQHAERLVLGGDGPVPIGVSREMCPPCQGFFRSEAVRMDTFIVVADPRVLVFLPDGTVRSPDDF